MISDSIYDARSTKSNSFFKRTNHNDNIKNKRAKGDDFFKITSQKTKIEDAIKKVSDKETGALVIFIGKVRKAS